ncbi:MAG TPA: hypothetical protein VHL78_12025 [Actinomycetota bacterium]|nr:hypothetical protein [Actinomycetota bacterium]
MIGETEATVAEARPFGLHGVTYHDVTLAYPDGSTETARLGPEAVPERLAQGERVMVLRAAGVVVSIRRP